MKHAIRKVAAGMLLALVSIGAHAAAYDFGTLFPGDSRSSLGFPGAGLVMGSFADTWSFQLADNGSTLSSAVSLNLSNFFHISGGEYGLYSGTVGSGTELGSWTFDGASGDAYHVVSLMAAGPYYFSVSGVADGIAGGQYMLSVTAVPEPETYALLLAGLGVVGFFARRRNGLSTA